MEYWSIGHYSNTPLLHLMTIHVRPIRDSAERDACYLVRMKVFVEEQKVPPWEEMDEFDESAEHYAALCDGKIVGTARLVDKGGGLAKVGRVAVLNEHRGKGLGKALMQAIADSARMRFEALTLDAQLYVIPFYESLGYTAEGDIFLDAGIEHRRMTLRFVQQEPDRSP